MRAQNIGGAVLLHDAVVDTKLGKPRHPPGDDAECCITTTATQRKLPRVEFPHET